MGGRLIVINGCFDFQESPPKERASFFCRHLREGEAQFIQEHEAASVRPRGCFVLEARAVSFKPGLGAAVEAFSVLLAGTIRGAAAGLGGCHQFCAAGRVLVVAIVFIALRRVSSVQGRKRTPAGPLFFLVVSTTTRLQHVPTSPCRVLSASAVACAVVPVQARALFFFLLSLCYRHLDAGAGIDVPPQSRLGKSACRHPTEKMRTMGESGAVKKLS